MVFFGQKKMIPSESTVMQKGMKRFREDKRKENLMGNLKGRNIMISKDRTVFLCCI